MRTKGGWEKIQKSEKACKIKRKLKVIVECRFEVEMNFWLRTKIYERKMWKYIIGGKGRFPLPRPA